MPLVMSVHQFASFLCMSRVTFHLQPNMGSVAMETCVHMHTVEPRFMLLHAG